MRLRLIVTRARIIHSKPFTDIVAVANLERSSSAFYFSMRSDTSGNNPRSRAFIALEATSLKQDLVIERFLEDVGGEFPRLEHVWADMGYRGKVVEWIKKHLGWTVEIVKQPRRWFRVAEGEEVPFVPAFVVLPRRCRRRAHVRVGGSLSSDEQRL